MAAQSNRQQNKTRHKDDASIDDIASIAPTPVETRFLSKPLIFLFHMSLITICVYMITNAYFGTILSTIERQFGLNSAESALLSQVNDIAGALVGVPFAYIAGKSSRPIWLAICIILMAIGNLMSAIPHYLLPPVNSSFEYPASIVTGNSSTEPNVHGGICISQSADSFETNQTSSIATEYACDNEVESSAGLTGKVGWILAGQIVFGFGQSVFLPLVFSYMDDLLGRDRVAFASYNAVLLVLGTIGPIIGILLGGFALSQHVDFDRIPANDIADIPMKDPRWIGAWWVGFLVSGVGLLILVLPVPFYPRNPYTQQEHNNNINKGRDNMAVNRKPMALMKAFAKELKQLLSIPTLVFYLLYNVSVNAYAGVLTAFFVKYVIVSYGISPSHASYLNAGALVPCAMVGILLSVIICRIKMSHRHRCGILICATIVSIALLCTLLFVGCSNPSIAGVHQPYNTHLDTEGYACNNGCHCPDGVFQPVCGSDGITYVSPCLAGCQMNSGNNTVYGDCLCIDSPSSQIGIAVPGLCERDCDKGYLYTFIVVFGILIILWTMVINIVLMVVLGCSNGIEKTFLFGVNGFLGRLLGQFPTPVYFGAIINTTCSLWQYTCDVRTACWLYDLISLRYVFIGILLAIKCITLVSTCGMFATTSNIIAGSENQEENDDIVTKESVGHENKYAMDLPSLMN